jgi:hypothetical protein
LLILGACKKIPKPSISFQILLLETCNDDVGNDIDVKFSCC